MSANLLNIYYPKTYLNSNLLFILKIFDKKAHNFKIVYLNFNKIFLGNFLMLIFI